jgi:hypothetical protein
MRAGQTFVARLVANLQMRESDDCQRCADAQTNVLIRWTQFALFARFPAPKMAKDTEIINLDRIIHTMTTSPILTFRSA